MQKGAGYWIWKPYIVNKRLSEIRDGDTLVYLDAGCSIRSKGEKRFGEYLDMLGDSECGVMAFQLPYLEKEWTVKEIFQHFDLEPDGELANTGQIMGGCCIIRKTGQAVEIVEQWYNTLAANPLLFTDHYSDNQAPYFRENRHDQSVFSIIRKMHNTVLLPNEIDLRGQPDSKNAQSYPFSATRVKDSSRLSARFHRCWQRLKNAIGR